VRLCDTRGVIRPFTDDDLDGVLEVWYRASVEAHSFLGEGFFDAERRRIAEQWLPTAETLVFVIDGRVVGFVSMLGSEVGGIFVDPAHQGRGVGRSLMDSVTARRPYVVLDVFRANAIGRRFYDAYGFRDIGGGADETTGLPVRRLRFDSVAQ
jgi:putative acetyltransferase